MATLEDLIAAKDEFSSRLLRARVSGRDAAMARALSPGAARRNAGRNLHGVGVARKLVGGKETTTRCVRLCVVQKLRASALPRAALLPREIGGVPTDVVQLPPPRFLLSSCSARRKKALRPFVGGISAAHYLVNVATLGAFCRSLKPGEERRQYLLGCNHSLANLDAGLVGDAILQPSVGDGGVSPDHVVGRLSRWIAINMDGSTPNLVDAAIAEVVDRVALKDGICSIGSLNGVKAATVGMRVRKHGRTTGRTVGQVVGVDFDWLVPYVPAAGLFARFVKQIYVEPAPGYGAFALEGDSGSVVVALNSQHAVGLLFAGASNGTYSLANPMRAVCGALNIRIP